MPKVSIIVAAYNIENYIEQALNSAINQTLKDIEIIVVDDGSTDKTPAIIESFAQSDPRIVPITHSQNKGLMLARKSGYDVARGNYIMFLDGDDYYNENACETAYNAIELQKTDILHFGINTFGDNTDFSKEIMQLLNKPAPLFSTDQPGGLYNCEDILSVNHCIFNKIYKKELVQKVSAQLPDEHIYLAEDMLFTYIAFFHATSISSIPDLLINYRVGTGVSTTKSVTESRRKAVAKCYFIYTFLKKWSENKPTPSNCQKRLSVIYSEMLLHISRMLLVELPSDMREKFIAELTPYCPPASLVTGLVHAVYRIALTEVEQLSEICSSLSLFKSVPHEIKTVGLLGNHLQEQSAYWNEKGCKTVLLTQQEIPFSDHKSIFDTKERVHAILNAIETHSIDMVVWCQEPSPLVAADALTVKCTGVPFIVSVNNAFLDGFKTHEIYTARNLAVMYKNYRFTDGIITPSRQDYFYFKALGVPCFMPMEFKPELVFKADTPLPLNDAEQALKLVSENMEIGINAHLTQNRTAEELKASVAYAKNLENQLRDAVEYGHQLEDIIAEKDGYIKDLSESISREKETPPETPQKTISLIQKIKNRIKK